MLKKYLNLNKKAISLLLCIVSAFALWVYVSYVENPEMTRSVKHIPITIEGEAELNRNGIAIKSLSDEDLNLTINSKRSNFRHLSADSITAIIDVSSLSSIGNHKLNVSISFPPSTTGVSITNKNVTVDVELEKFVTEDFKVMPRLSGNAPAGYSIHEMSIGTDDNIVHVSGGESAIKRISKVTTSTVDISDITTDFTKPVSLGHLIPTVTLSITSASASKVPLLLNSQFTVPNLSLLNSIFTAILPMLKQSALQILWISLAPQKKSNYGLKKAKRFLRIQLTSIHIVIRTMQTSPSSLFLKILNTRTKPPKK